MHSQQIPRGGGCWVAGGPGDGKNMDYCIAHFCPIWNCIPGNANIDLHQ